MKSEIWRLALGSGGLLVLLAAMSVPGCGGSSSKKVPSERQPDASLGDAGEGGSGEGGRAHGGTGGAELVGGEAGALTAGGTSTGGTTGEAAGAGNGGASGETGAEGGITEPGGGGAAGGDAPPDIDAGVDCIAPDREPRLSATAAGLPASGLALWVRADRGVYMTAAHRVCAWADQSGNDHLLSSTGPARPLWVAASLGGQAAVHFDATGSYLLTNGVLDIPPTSGRTFIAVVRLVSTAGRFQPVQQGQSGTPGTYLQIDANTWQTAGNREGAYATSNSYDSQLATSTSPRIHVYTLANLVAGTAIVSALDYRVNGATQSLTLKQGGSGTLEDFSKANYTLVGDVDAVSTVAPAVGDAFVAEALIYSRALTVPERASAEAALEARYGISP